MKYLVKDTPIRKNNKTYGVGEEFPYSESDKSLLQKGYLEEVKEEAPKDEATKKAEAEAKKKATAEKKKLATAKKKAEAEAKKTNSKK